MALKIPRCSKCGDPNELKTLPSVSGLDGPLQLTVLEMPVFACAKKHKAPVHREFMLWLISEIRAREAQIAAGREEGMIFKKYLCGGCGKEQVRSTKQLHDHVAQSVMGINDAAGFPHSG